MIVNQIDLENISYADLIDYVCRKLLLDLQEGNIRPNDFREASRTLSHIGTGLDLIINKNVRF